MEQNVDQQGGATKVVSSLKSRLEDHSREALVLSTLCDSPDCQHLALEKLSSEMFSDPKMKKIFGYSRRLLLEGKTLSEQTIKDAIYLDAKPDSELLIKAVEQVCFMGSSPDVEVDCEYLRTLYMNRVIYQDISLQTGKMFMMGASHEQIMEYINSQLIKLESGYEAEKLPDIAQAVANRILSPKAEDYGLYTGLRDFDRLFFGVKRDRLFVIGASPSIGKSAVMVDIIHRLCSVYNESIAVCLFSLEMSEEDVVERLISRETGFDSSMLAPEYAPRLTSMQRDAIEKAAKKIAAYSIEIYYNTFTQGEIRRIGEKFMREHPNRQWIFVVDHLGEVDISSDDERRETDKTMAVLKGFCRKNKATCFALTQLTKEAQSKNNAPQFYRPHNGFIMNSVGVEAKANAVILLWRPEHYGIKEMPYGEKVVSTVGKMFLCVTKNRGGRRGTIFLDAQMGINKFENYTEDDPKQTKIFAT